MRVCDVIDTRARACHVYVTVPPPLRYGHKAQLRSVRLSVRPSVRLFVSFGRWLHRPGHIVSSRDTLFLIPTAMVQNTNLPFFLGYDPKTAQNLTPTTTKFREPRTSNGMNCNKTE